MVKRPSSDVKVQLLPESRFRLLHDTSPEHKISCQRASRAEKPLIFVHHQKNHPTRQGCWRITQTISKPFLDGLWWMYYICLDLARYKSFDRLVLLMHVSGEFTLYGEPS